jgi:rhodanese-related sulfurtransferase
MRSRKAGKKLITTGHDEAFHLAGGLMDWKKSGFPVQGAR